jgi:hypothetical protein
VRRKHFFAVLSGLVAVALLAADASATYHPTLGRWMQRDPIGYADSMHLYEYVSTSPVAARDPYGLMIGDLLGGRDIGVRVRRNAGHTWLSYPGQSGNDDLGKAMGYPSEYSKENPEDTWIARQDTSWFRTMQDGPAAGKTCNCVTLDDVYGCFGAVQADGKWNNKNFDVTHWNCRDFVRDALRRCCLIEPSGMAYDMDHFVKKGINADPKNTGIEHWVFTVIEKVGGWGQKMTKFLDNLGKK